MKMKFAQVLACAAALCSAVGATAPQPMSAEAWLSEVPPLPATADAAYAQWVDVSGGLKPGPASERVSNGIKTEVLTLSRPMPAAVGSEGPVSAHDRALIEKISVFSDTAAVLQKIQAARTAQAALLQKWRAELNALEQRRLLARSALPACHNDASAPSQAAIRDVEQSFLQQKIAIAVRYLGQFRPLVEQMLAAVSPRIGHGDSAMAAWAQLRGPDKKAQLAPVAHGAESDALLDVALVESYIQDISKLAARPVAERNAVGRVYAQAKGC
jgi:hypothetical protein